MSAHQASFSITAMARVLGVATAGYYAWLKRVPSRHAEADAPLLQRIRTAHTTSRATYGVPRVRAEVRAGGKRHGRKRIARMMREAGLVGVSRCRAGVQTTRRDREARPAPFLVNLDFSANGRNQLGGRDHFRSDRSRVPVSGRRSRSVGPQDRRLVIG